MLLQATMDNIKENKKFGIIGLPSDGDVMRVVNQLKIDYPNIEFAGEEIFKWLKWNPKINEIPDEFKLKDVYWVFLGGIMSGETKKHGGDLSMSAPVLEWDRDLFQFRGRGPSIPTSTKCKTIIVQNLVD